MLRLTMETEEYLMIGDDVKIAFLGGTKNHLRILVDAPREVPIVRSKVLGKEKEYYKVPDLDEKYRKKRQPKEAAE